MLAAVFSGTVAVIFNDLATALFFGTCQVEDAVIIFNKAYVTSDVVVPATGLLQRLVSLLVGIEKVVQFAHKSHGIQLLRDVSHRLNAIVDAFNVGRLCLPPGVELVLLGPDVFWV
jgi:hypothetical protein